MSDDDDWSLPQRMSFGPDHRQVAGAFVERRRISNRQVRVCVDDPDVDVVASVEASASHRTGGSTGGVATNHRQGDVARAFDRRHH